MIHHLDNGGTMACVLPHGVLFRGAAEGHIRKYLIEDCNYLDAVIGLPSNIFFGTGIPTCILVLKKQRENPDDILFIDASQGFEKVGNQNYLRPEHVERIVSTHRKRESIAKFSHVADRSEVAENDYNLNIPRYVDTFDEEEPVNLDVVVSNIATIEEIIADADDIVRQNCAELGMPFPAGHNLSLMEAYKKGVMQQLFTQALRFKDDHGNDFPDWEEKTLGEVGSVVGGGTPDSTKDDYWNGDIEWFTPTEIRSKYAGGSRRKITESGMKNCSASILPVGTLLMTSRATIAEISISTIPCTTNQGFQSITTNSENNNEFIYYWIKNNKKMFLRKSQGSTFIEISGKEVRKLAILIPSLPEQTKIANFLTALDRKIESVSQQITHTQTVKKGLLQQMFV
jgi:hypothetical protein